MLALPRRSVRTGVVLGVILCAAGLAAPTAGAAEVAPATGPGVPVGGVLLTSNGMVPPVGAIAPPPVTAVSYVVADADSGAVLAAKSPHRKLRPASTLKALTAVTLQPRLAAMQVYTASEVDERIEGSKAGMVSGGTYTAGQLFLAMFLRSGNDATHGLAMLHGGVQKTVADMNAEARRLQALDTHAVTPEGLDADGQISSAYDLALIGRAAIANPALVKYATTAHARFPGKVPVRGPRPGFQLWSEQKYVMNYDGAIGLKNGYTSLARNTLVAAATRNGHTVLVTLMGGGSGTWREAVALSDWYFGGGLRAQPVGELVPPVDPTAPAATTADTGGADAAAGDAEHTTSAVTVASSAVTAPLLPDWLRLPLQLIAALAALVVALRTRVVLRTRRRHRRRAALARARALPGHASSSSEPEPLRTRATTSARTPSKA